MSKIYAFAALLLICLGCVNQQWVRDYVGTELVTVKTDVRALLQPIEQGVQENKKQITGLQDKLSEIETSMQGLEDKINIVSESVGGVQGGVSKDVEGLRKELQEALAEFSKFSERFDRMEGVLQQTEKGLQSVNQRVEQLGMSLEAAPAQPPAALPR